MPEVKDNELLKLIQLKPEQVEAARRAAEERISAKPKRRVAGTFVIAELGSLKAAADALRGLGAHALLVWLYLVFETRRRSANTIRASNVALDAWGVDRRVKYRALKRLEAAGLIVLGRETGRSVEVSVLPAGASGPVP